MARRLFTFLALVSLLLFFALIVLWIRSIGHVDSLHWSSPGLNAEFEDVHGVVGIEIAQDSGLYPPVSGSKRYGWFWWRINLSPGRDRASLSTPSFNRWGFAFHLGKTIGRPQGNWSIGGRRLWIIYFPYWLVVTMTGIPPAAMIIRFIRRRRRRGEGCCPSCGYDLRATPERCPECGNRPIAASNGVR
jgi:hypothetical protein